MGKRPPHIPAEEIEGDLAQNADPFNMYPSPTQICFTTRAPGHGVLELPPIYLFVCFPSFFLPGWVPCQRQDTATHSVAQSESTF